MQLLVVVNRSFIFDISMESLLPTTTNPVAFSWSNDSDEKSTYSADKKSRSLISNIGNWYICVTCSSWLSTSVKMHCSPKKQPPKISSVAISEVLTQQYKKQEKWKRQQSTMKDDPKRKRRRIQQKCFRGRREQDDSIYSSRKEERSFLFSILAEYEDFPIENWI